MRNRRERFISLAEARTGRAMKAIRLVGNLSNRANYEYTDEDVNQILRALETEIRSLRARFTDSSTGRDITFRLRG